LCTSLVQLVQRCASTVGAWATLILGLSSALIRIDNIRLYCGFRCCTRYR